jgi:hypothetical protein
VAAAASNLISESARFSGISQAVFGPMTRLEGAHKSSHAQYKFIKVYSQSKPGPCRGPGSKALSAVAAAAGDSDASTERSETITVTVATNLNTGPPAASGPAHFDSVRLTESAGDSESALCFSAGEESGGTESIAVTSSCVCVHRKTGPYTCGPGLHPILLYSMHTPALPQMGGVPGLCH